MFKTKEETFREKDLTYNRECKDHMAMGMIRAKTLIKEM